jgi:hypothetical protein
MMIGCYSKPQYPVIWGLGVQLGAVLGLLVVANDCILSMLMIRKVLQNQSWLGNIYNSAAKEKMKRRLIILFSLLLATDLLDIIGNLLAQFRIKIFSPQLVLTQIITIPFFFALHLIVLFALLDSFKSEVLKPAGAKTDHSFTTNVITAASQKDSEI